MADLSKPISYNSLSINTVSRTSSGTPMSGYEVNEFNLAAVAVRQYLDGRATADGIDASDVYLGRRDVELIVTAYGSTIGDFWDKANALLGAFSPTVAYAADTANLGFLAFDYYQPTADIETWPLSAYPSGIPLRMYLRPNGLPSYTSRRDDQGGVSGKGTSKQFRIPMIARDPRKVLQAETTVSIGTGSTLATATGAYRGNFPTTWTAIVTTVNTTPVVVEIEGSAYTVAPELGGTFTIDAADRVLYKATTLRMDLLTWSSWPTIGLSPPILLRRLSGNASVALKYREAFA